MDFAEHICRLLRLHQMNWFFGQPVYILQNCFRDDLTFFCLQSPCLTVGQNFSSSWVLSRQHNEDRNDRHNRVLDSIPGSEPDNVQDASMVDNKPVVCKDMDK